MLHASRPPSPLRVPRGGSKNKGNPQSMFSLPAADETLRLINEFFSNTGMLFPYIHRETFLATYHDLTTTDFRKVRRSWLGLLNMVLAMATSASDSSHLTGQQRADESEVFFLRALALCEKQIRCAASLEIGKFSAPSINTLMSHILTSNHLQSSSSC